MADLDNCENSYYTSLSTDDRQVLPDCYETQSLNEQMNANQVLKCAENAQRMVDDFNSDTVIMGKEEQRLDCQFVEEYTNMTKNQIDFETAKNSDSANTQLNSDIGKSCLPAPCKIVKMRSILKNALNKKANSDEGATHYNLELPLNDTTMNSPNFISDTLPEQFFCDCCGQCFDSFVNLYDHQNKVHGKAAKCIDDSKTEKSSCTINITKSNGTIIKVQDENSTRIIIDYDITKDNKQQQKVIPKSELLLQAQDEKVENNFSEYCQICSRILFTKKEMRKHLKKEHSIVSNENNNRIRCLDCNLDFKSMNEFREHLENFHDLDMKPLMLFFPTMDAFFTWKCNIERESLCAYYLAERLSGFKYCCSRSGKRYLKPRQKKNYHTTKRLVNSLKLGVSCPSEIYAERSPDGVLVTYYPIHYGHGKEIGITRVFPAEKAAVNELVNNGVPFEKLMKELKGGEIIDNNQIYPLKKRYLKWVKQSFLAPNYHSDFSDVECISQWVQKCCSIEECPILLCRLGNMECTKDLFILVIMTDFQKQILLSNSKELICVDVRNQKKRVVFVMYVIDELRRAFPVAYCFCNNFNKNIVSQFFNSIREHAGCLRPQFLISNMKPCIYEAWVDVMGTGSLWLWSHWSVRKSINQQLRIHVKKHAEERCDVFDTMKIIMDCKSKDVFACMYNNLVNKLQANEVFKKFQTWLVKNLGSSPDKWARCYINEVSYLTSLHLESLHHSIEIACFKANKQKSVFRLIHVLMKILRNRMMDRILDSFDDEKINLSLHAINLCHERSMSIPEEDITLVCEKLWSIMIDDGEMEFVTQEVESCPDYCSLKCKECKICVHMYSCSCMNNMINSNLCMHIHAVAYKIWKEQRSQPPSPSTCEPINDSKNISLHDFQSFHKHMYSSIQIKNIESPMDSNSSQPPPFSINKAINSTKEILHNDNQSFDRLIQRKNTTSKVKSKENSSLLQQLCDSVESTCETNDLNEMDARQIVLKKITELYKKVTNYKLTDTTLLAIRAQLNLCNKMASRKKNVYSQTETKSSIPINAVYVIKPKNSENQESVTKKSIKRIRFPSIGENNANLKKFKMNTSSKQKISSKKLMEELISNKRFEVQKVTHFPLALVPTENVEDLTDSTMSENVILT